jgi:hypothetical protein
VTSNITSASRNGLILTVATGVWFTTAQFCASQIWSSTVDWYHPPPLSLKPSNADIALSGALFISVPVRFREGAIARLGEKDVISLTRKECEALSVPWDAAPLLHSEIKEKQEKLSFFLAHPLDEDSLRSAGHNEQAIVQIRKSHQGTIDSLRSAIVSLQRLEGTLRPYLAKAVALNETTGLFCGTLAADSLVIVHGCLGDHPMPMKKVPVVVFLPRKPEHVYHELSMAK